MKLTLEHNHSSSTAIGPAHTKRLDIQGLRAIAVLAVVANHMFQFPLGGFVGVDVFFVISGFVITLGLLREHERTGSISFRDFYFRRAARILPAGVLTIAITVAIGYLVFFTERANSILSDGLWALFFSANWRFAIEGTNYWGEGIAASPLQHYWSLGVEEQFYFVWPLVLFVVLGLCARRGLRLPARRRVLSLLLSAIIVSTFIWAIRETAENASWAYFSTSSRIWELGVGALLAIICPIFSRIGPRTAKLLGIFGVLGIAASILFISKSLLFPAPWAAVPVVSTALVIASGSTALTSVQKFLGNRYFTYVGNISYSLYLWHFPVIAFVVALRPADDLMRYPVMILAMALFSILSYEFVEIPAQRHLTALYKTGKITSRVNRRDSNGSLRLQYAGVASLLVATMIVTPLAFHRQRPIEITALSPEFTSTSPEISVEPPASPTTETSEMQLSAQIEEALAATEWPALSPSLDKLLAEGKPEEDKFGCGNTDLSIPNCVFGVDKPQTIVVLGDSTGITLLPTVRAAYGDEFNYRGMTKAGCTLLDIDIKMDREGAAAECRDFLSSALEEINKIKPAIVFLTNDVRFRFTSGAKALNAQEEWRAGTESVLKSMAPSGARLVVVTAPPQGKPPTECATRASKPSDCVYAVSSQWKLATNAINAAAATVGADLIDTSKWFCNSSGNCPAFVGETPVKRDGVHTTPQYAARLVPVLQDALQRSNT